MQATICTRASRSRGWQRPKLGSRRQPCHISKSAGGSPDTKDPALVSLESGEDASGLRFLPVGDALC